MLKIEKYDINNFYVGELYLSCGLEGFFNDGMVKKQSVELDKIFDIYKTEIINFQKTLIKKYEDDDLMRKYEGFLTIFYKIGNKYACLHNGILYELDGIDFCDNLICLSELLPKLSYSIPKKVSIKEAICIFNLLFKNKNGIKLNNTKYDINDFYIGNLVLHEGYLPNDGYNSRYKYDSLALQYILYNNGATVGSMHGREDEFTNLHDFSSFKSLFLRDSKGLYNLQSYQYYNGGVLEQKYLDSRSAFNSYCECMEPFSSVLDENKIEYNSHSITIPKALKLYKKIDI